ncbi:MAG: protein tyrosine phosphatase [Kiritimatiellae bacterium]|jgi:predicted protein tyrosine phosphatase|nr:protein tyrosine phosphatase [Kiritimatiellia bacterium]
MTSTLRILFVCGRNQWRSPTAERMYARDPRVEVRSAGVGAASRRQVSAGDMDWADLILVMEPEHKTRLQQRFRGRELPPIYSLDIPDEYGFMDSELIGLIRDRTEMYLPVSGENV